MDINFSNPTIPQKLGQEHATGTYWSRASSICRSVVSAVNCFWASGAKSRLQKISYQSKYWSCHNMNQNINHASKYCTFSPTSKLFETAAVGQFRLTAAWRQTRPAKSSSSCYPAAGFLRVNHLLGGFKLWLTLEWKYIVVDFRSGWQILLSITISARLRSRALDVVP